MILNMTSYQNLMPGKRSDARKIIKYVAEYNIAKPDSPKKNCLCISDKYDKFVTGSDSPSIQISTNMRIAQLIKFYKGGKTQYGNSYLGQPLNLNYLGRMEGMPGGSGSPPSNF
jgi:hypothetical protein